MFVTGRLVNVSSTKTRNLHYFTQWKDKRMAPLQCPSLVYKDLRTRYLPNNVNVWYAITGRNVSLHIAIEWICFFLLNDPYTSICNDEIQARNERSRRSTGSHVFTCRFGSRDDFAVWTNWRIWAVFFQRNFAICHSEVFQWFFSLKLWLSVVFEL